jgi:class 3 adenylate cyclase
MAEFSSPVVAVRAALEIHAKVSTLNANLPKAKRLQFRMGITHGPGGGQRE